MPGRFILPSSDSLIYLTSESRQSWTLMFFTSIFWTDYVKMNKVNFKFLFSFALQTLHLAYINILNSFFYSTRTYKNMFLAKRKLVDLGSRWSMPLISKRCCQLTTVVDGLDVGGLQRIGTKLKQQNVFLQHIHESVYQLESSVGCTQQRLNDNLQMLFTSIDTLKGRQNNTEATAENQFSSHGPPKRLSNDPIKNRKYINKIIESVQMKYSTQIKLNSSSFCSSSSSFVAGIHNIQQANQAQILKPLIEMIDDQINEHVLPDQIFNTHLSRGAPPKSNLNHLPENLKSVFPKDFFMLFVMAKLLMTNIFSSGLMNACAQLSPTEQNDLNRHLFFVLNIIHLMKLAIDNRRSFSIGVKSMSSSSKFKNTLSEILIFGNVCFYNITYMLMKLNIQNISELISCTLKDFTTIEYSIEKEIPNFFRLDQIEGQEDELNLSPAFFEMLCSGQLLGNYHQLFHYQQLNLLPIGCKAIAHLFGTNVHYDRHLIQMLGYNLASTLTLVDDYYCLKYAYPADTTDLSLLTAGPSQAMSLLLRLPVLLHLKEILKPKHYDDLKNVNKLVKMVK